MFGLAIIAASLNLMVLKFMTLNTEDEKRDEQQAIQVRKWHTVDNFTPESFFFFLATLFLPSVTHQCYTQQKKRCDEKDRLIISK